MATKIVITEDQYTKLLGSINEQMENNPLFKSTYNSEDKTTTASYWVMDETPNSYVVVNPKEYKSNYEWADGAQDYGIRYHITQLPKSKVEIIGSIPNFPQFKIFKIPYWLYKKDPKLEIKRFEGNKRMTLPKDRQVLIDITKQNIEGAFLALGGDVKKFLLGLENATNPPKPIEKPYQKPDQNVDQDLSFYRDRRWTGD